MILNVDVLAFSLSDGVLSYENSTEVVALDGDRVEYKSNFLEKLSDPDDLANRRAPCTLLLWTKAQLCAGIVKST